MTDGRAAGTTERVLRLLDLLQSRAVWTGPELAERLGVTTRSVRRDVDRLRALGYPVHAGRGAGGGYQLGAGRGMPPLLLDDEEAVAVAISLRLAAAGTVSGSSEAAVRTLAKLDQVMPPRLRGQLRAIHEATETLGEDPEPIDGDALLVLARACRDRVRARFGYEDRDGAPSRRLVEPVRLVAAGRRWYLMAWDVDRDDWRTFRLDRLTDVGATTWGFPPRDHPDPVGFVQRAVSSGGYRHRARVRFRAPAATIRAAVPAPAGEVIPLAPDDEGERCELRAGADRLTWIALHVAAIGAEFEVMEPPELLEEVRRLSGRLSRAAAR